MRLTGQVAMITGAASGIGRATAQAFARDGARVALVDRDGDGLAALAGELGDLATVFQADLGSRDGLPDLVRSIVEALGRIDILVNCAGITAAPHNSIEFTDEQLDAVLGINLRAPLILVREVGRHMIDRGGGGRIVNISSSSAFRAMLAPAVYAATKAGINGLTRAAAADLGPHGINVNSVAPGPTRTAMMSGAGSHFDEMAKTGPLANLLQRPSEPEDVAAVILFLCLPESRQITGQVVHTSAGQVV